MLDWHSLVDSADQKQEPDLSYKSDSNPKLEGNETTSKSEGVTVPLKENDATKPNPAMPKEYEEKTAANHTKADQKLKPKPASTSHEVLYKDKKSDLAATSAPDLVTPKPPIEIINLKVDNAQSSRVPNWIKHGFPPPEYLRFNFAGINLSDHSIKVCKTVIDKEHYLIDMIDTITLPEGSIVNGELQDSEAVSKMLAKIADTYKIDFVRISIPEEKVYLVTFTIPPTSPEKLRSVIEFHIGDHIPLSVDEINFDFDVIKTNAANKVTEVVVIAAAKSTTRELIDLANSAGLIPFSLEVEAQAIARVVTSENDKKTHMVLDIGRSRTGISIIKDGIVRYTTTIEFGGDVIVECLAKLRNIDMVAAEKLKRADGLDLSKYNESEQVKLEEIMVNLIHEINRRKNYWQSQTGGVIDEVLLVGGNASTPQLTKYLAKQTNLPVKIANIWQNVYSDRVSDRPVSDSEALGYAAVIGLAISEEK